MTLFIWKWKWKCASKFFQMPLIWNSALMFLVLISQLMCSSFFADALEAANLNSNTNTNTKSSALNFNFSSSSKPELQVQVRTSRNGYGQFKDYDEDEPLVFTESLDEISVKCNAFYPIEWRWSSQMPQDWADYTIIKSKAHHIQEASHKLEIQIQPKDGFFGYLGSCHYIEDQNDTACGNGEEFKNISLETRLQIFAPGENSKAKYFIGAGGRFKIRNRNKVKIPAKFESTSSSSDELESGFLIPCPLMTKEVPTGVNITLYQIFSEREEEKVEKVKYDPKAGFYISEFELELQKLNGTFQCRAGEAGEHVTFEFVQNKTPGEDWHYDEDAIKNWPKAGPKDTQVFSLGRFGQKITCSSWKSIANVKPTFKWTKINDNGTEEKVEPRTGNETHMGFKLSYSPDKTILTFPRIRRKHQGTYVCTATWSWTLNSSGTSTSVFIRGSKQFYIQVKKWKFGMAVYIVIALGSLGTLVGLIVCARKRWKVRGKA